MNSWILNTLAEAGYRRTVPRTTLAHFLSRYEGVFSAGDIARHIPEADRVSMYRALNLFAKLDIIHPVFQKDGERHYEVHGKKEHKHHVVCERCSASAMVPCRVPNARVAGFSVTHHTVAFSGLCDSCQAKK